MKKYIAFTFITLLIGGLLTIIFPQFLQAKKERDTFFEKARFI